MNRRRPSRAAGTTLFPEERPLRFDQQLVLFQWLLSLFEKADFPQLAEPLKLAELEGLNEDNNHRFLGVFRALWELAAFPGDTLLGYDQNIVRHTLQLNERRPLPRPPPRLLRRPRPPLPRPRRLRDGTRRDLPDERRLPLPPHRQLPHLWRRQSCLRGQADSLPHLWRRQSSRSLSCPPTSNPPPLRLSAASLK